MTIIKETGKIKIRGLARDTILSLYNTHNKETKRFENIPFAVKGRDGNVYFIRIGESMNL